MNYTKAPWRVKYGYLIVAGDDDRFVATLDSSPGTEGGLTMEALDNARLIAAAPLLYETLLAVARAGMPLHLSDAVMNALGDAEGR